MCPSPPIVSGILPLSSGILHEGHHAHWFDLGHETTHASRNRFLMARELFRLTQVPPEK